MVEMRALERACGPELRRISCRDCFLTDRLEMLQTLHSNKNCLWLSSASICLTMLIHQLQVHLVTIDTAIVQSGIHSAWLEDTKLMAGTSLWDYFDTAYELAGFGVTLDCVETMKSSSLSEYMRQEDYIPHMFGAWAIDKFARTPQGLKQLFSLLTSKKSTQRASVLHGATMTWIAKNISILERGSWRSIWQYVGIVRLTRKR